MGDRPAWMKIKKYREEGRRAELILALGSRKKDYWFPVSPNVYSNFREKIADSRSVGLKYLQKYIRRYRGYAEMWPSKRYQKKNRINDTLLESSLASRAMKMFRDGMTAHDISLATYIPEHLVDRLLEVTGLQGARSQSKRAFRALSKINTKKTRPVPVKGGAKSPPTKVTAAML